MFYLKNTARAGLGLISIAAFLLCMEPQAKAQAFSITIMLDENGRATFTNTNGFNSPLPFTLQADVGPGGLSSALTYSLLNPPGLTAGDLLLLEPGGSGLLSDIVRFNPNETCSGSTGCLVFYSDTVDGADSLADKGFPTALYSNNLANIEVGPEGNNGFSYRPTAGQPGFVAGAGGPVTYIIQSDSPVPEPSTLVLLGMGLTAFSVIAYRRRRLPA